MKYLLAFLLAQAPGEEIGATVVTSARSLPPSTDTLADRTVVTAEELAATGERSLPRQLAKAAGVWVQETNLGGGSPLVQGLSGNQVLLVVDGVRMNDSTTRNGVNQMLNGIDPATVERVEVIRGPRSVLYGTDAIGGVVLVWTKTRKPHRGDEAAGGWGFGVEGHADSAYDGLAGAALGSYAGESLAGLAIFGYHDYGDVESADGEVPNTGYYGNSGFGAFEAALGARRSLRVTSMITVDYDVPRTDRLNPGFGQTDPANDEFDFSEQNRQRYLVAYSDRSDDLFVDALEARVSYRYYKEDRTIRGFGSDTRRLETDQSDTVGLGVDMKEAIGENHLLTFGFDTDYDDVDSTRTDVDVTTGIGTPNDGAFAPGSKFFSGGVFVQDEISSFDPWDVTVGARWNYYEFGFEDISTGEDEDGSFNALGGSLSAGRPVAKDVRVVGTLAHGFRAPNLAELARDATFFGGDELHNADLDPETSLYAEVALEVVKPTWNGALAVYRNAIDDVVGSVLVDPGGPGPGDETYLRENIGELEIYGVFARGTTKLGGADSPWSTSLAAEYTYGQQYSDFVDPATNTKPFDDEPGQRIPPFHGWVGLRYDFGPRWLEWVELTFNWALEQDRLSPQDLGDPRIDPDGTDGWTTLDLDVGGPIGDQDQVSRRAAANWYLGLHNLTDESYKVHGSGMDAPGFGVVVGASWSR